MTTLLRYLFIAGLLPACVNLSVIAAGNAGYYEKANRYYLDAQNDSALLCLDKALTASPDTADRVRLVEMLLLRSTVSGSLTFFERAMTDALKAHNIAKKERLDKLTVKSLLAIGKVHYLMYNDTLAEDYMLQAKKLAEDKKLVKELMLVNNSLAQLYSVMERNDECVALATQSLETARLLNDTLNIVTNLNLFGSYYINLNRWTDPIIPEYQRKAKRYLDEALKLSRAAKIPMLTLTIYFNLVRYYRVEKDYPRALEQAQKVTQLCTPTQYSLLIQVYDHLVGIYAHLGNTKMTINSHQQFYRLMIRQSDYRLHQSLQDMSVKYQTAEKELIIKQQKAQRNMLLLLLGLAAALLALLWFLLRVRRKRNEALLELNATKDKFFSIISHDLKNPALSQRDALQLLAEQGSQWDADLLERYHSELLKSADGQVELLYNLLNWAQVQTGRMPYKPVTFDLMQAIRTDVSLTSSAAERKGVRFTAQVPESAIVTADVHMVQTVVRNLLNNAVKFTPKEGEVILRIEPKEAGYLVAISDSGMGMNREQLRNLFRLDRRENRKGTAGEPGSGLGLTVCKELLEKHSSRLHVESEEGKGSRFWFEIGLPGKSSADTAL